MFNQITPEKAGISSRNVLKFLKILDRYNLCTHSFIMARGKDIFAEGYYAPFHKDYKHRMYSVSKSFVGVAIGLAEEEGLLSIDDKFVKYFPEYVTEDTPEQLMDMTIREMLTMQTCMVKYPNWFYMGLENRCEAYFMTPVGREAGTTWSYDSPGSFMLCCIIEKLTGKPFLQYLKEKFLLKAGFSEDAYCLKCPGGYSFGDSGVMCTARDVLAFARFVMDGGKIDGVRYMNEEYLKEATKKQVSNSHNGEFSGGSYGYGYQIWKAPNDGFAFCGMGDQFAICDPEKDFIFIINSDNQGIKDFSRAILYHELYNLIVDNLGAPLDEDEQAFGELKDYIENLKLFSLRENTYSPVMEKINGKTYALEKNPMGIEWVRLEFYGKSGTVFYKNEQGEKELRFGFGYNEFSKFPQMGYSDMIASVSEPGHMYDCAVSADWPEEQKFRIKVQIIDKYFGNMGMEFGFKGEKVGISMYKSAEAFLDEYQGFANGKMIVLE